MAFLLRLRHWQVFLLLFVVPFLLQFGLPQLLEAASVRVGDTASLLLGALPSMAYVLWLWRVGLFLLRRFPGQHSSALFHMASVYFAGYTLLLLYTLELVKESVLAGSLPLGMLLLLVPLHLLATTCFLYMVYVAARCLVSAEQRREAVFGEFAGAYFLFMLLPIGIWWLQPRLRRLATGTARV